MEGLHKTVDNSPRKIQTGEVIVLAFIRKPLVGVDFRNCQFLKL